jgi:hypothetical protein
LVLGFFASLLSLDSSAHFANCDVMVSLSSDSTAWRFASCDGGGKHADCSAH